MKIFTSDKSLGHFAICGDLRNSFSNTFIFGLSGDFSCGIPSGIYNIENCNIFIFVNVTFCIPCLITIFKIRDRGARHIDKTCFCWLPCSSNKKNGYITKCKFQEYGERFVRYLKNHKLLDRPHLLIIDSHKSHVYNLPFYKLMIDNNIHILAITSYFRLIVQALNSTPFAQFNNNWKMCLKNGICFIF